MPHFYKNKLEIEKWLKYLLIKNFTIIPSTKYGFVVDVDGNVDLEEKNLDNIPVKFNIISENFNCGKNQLINLIGAPLKVGGNFLCYKNKLTSLQGSPVQVDMDFNCSHNKLKSLVGGAKNCHWHLCGRQ